MKKIASFILLLNIFFLYAQDISVKINRKHEIHDHKIFVSYYSSELKNPLVVIWRLTSENAIKSEQVNNRTNNFRKCGNNTLSGKSFGSVYDRGHMCPNNDYDFSEETASTTFLMCNMSPQFKGLNRGSWKTWEEKAHLYAKKYGHIDICCGTIFSEIKEYNTKENETLILPIQFFKIFYNKESKFMKCFIFNQSYEEPKECKIEDIEKLTNAKFSFER